MSFVTRLIYFLYQIVQIALSPALTLYLLYRGIRNPGYRGTFSERLGFIDSSVDTTGSGGVWLHAVSVGEVLSAVVLIRRLREEFPALPVYVSTATLAGHETAQHRLKGIADGVFYAPLDYRSVVRRVLRTLRPAAVVILETEIWPNLYREAKRAGASLVVVNGRISDRALPRYLRWKRLFAHVLQWPDAILVQSAEDARRYIAAGAPKERVSVAGNLKYDFTPPTAASGAVREFLERVNAGAVWIAASTMPPAEAGDPDEDDVVIDAFRKLAAEHHRPLMILVPRRPERFPEAAEKLERAGVRFVRRSELNSESSLELPGVLLLDSIGELAPLFAYADVVFMGGTLAHRGGHNVLEPAYFGKPVMTGPHMENFAEIEREFSAGGALVRIARTEELVGAVGALLSDRRRAREIGERARALAMAKRGVVDAVMQKLVHAMSEGVPKPPHKLWERVVLTPLSWLWAFGHWIDVKRSIAAQRGLATPVVSVGGLTVGGAGKSPMVAHLAERLHAQGRDPAILTRGYRRHSDERVVAVKRGESAGVESTGDEAQMFVRAGQAHVGIAAARFEAGRKLESLVHPDVFLLDDGFQHLRLKRDVDIVLVDANDPEVGGLLPLGRRREPMESLARSTAVVLTNTVCGREYTGVEGMLREYGARGPVFRSRVRPLGWTETAFGVEKPLDQAGFTRVGAFCGLASPRGFLRTLRELGLEIVFQWTFGDHHRYRAQELARLARQAASAGAEALVATEKDAMNLPEGAAEAVAPMKLYWLKIAVEIDNEEELLRLIRA